MTGLSHDISKTTMARLIVFLFSIGYFMIVARLLTKLEIATIAVFSIITSLASMVTNLGLSGSTMQRAPEFLIGSQPEKGTELLGLMVWVPVLLSCPLTIVVLSFPDFFSSLFLKSEASPGTIGWMALGIGVYRFQESSLFLLAARKDFSRQVIARWISEIGGRLLALMLYLKLGINGYLMGLNLGLLVSGGYAVGPYLPAFRIRWQPLLEWVRYSAYFYTYGYVRYATLQADQLIVSLLLSPTQLALYYVAHRFFDAVTGLVDAFLEPLIPRLSERRGAPRELEETFVKTSRYVGMITIFGGLALTGLAKPLLVLFAGSKYVTGAPILAYLGLAALGHGFYSHVILSLFPLAKRFEILLVEGICGLTNSAMVLALGFSLGVSGMAMARGVSFLAGVYFGRRRLANYQKARIDPIVKSLTVRLLPLTVVTYVCSLCFSHPITLFSIMVAYGVLAYLLCQRLFTKEDLGKLPLPWLRARVV